MPFVDPATRPLLNPAAPSPEPEAPGFFRETIPAAFRTENLIGSFLSRDANTPDRFGAEVDPDFNPFDHIEGYEEHARSFTLANTLEEVEAVKANIERERRDRQTLAASGAGGFVAALAAGIVDPTVFIPVGGTLKKGESLLRVSRNAMIAGGLSTGVQEAGLQASQELRTPEESALNIAGATVLSGLLGAGFAALTKAEQAKLAKAFEDDMRAPGAGEVDPADPFTSLPKKVVDDSLSAARVSRETLETSDNRLAYGAETIAKSGFRAVDPSLRLATARSEGVRNISEALFESPLIREKNKAKEVTVTLPNGKTEKRYQYGEASQQSVESNIARKTERYLGETQQGLNDIYQRYVFGGQKGVLGRARAGASALLQQGAGRGKMAPRDFEREVWKALARADEHDVPEVAEAAAHIRKTMLKPLEDEGVELGMFGFERQPSPFEGEPDVMVAKRPDIGSTALSYRPRLYNIDKIKRQRPELERRIFKHYQRERDRAVQLAAELDREMGRATGDIDFLRTEVREYIRDRKDIFREARKAVEGADAKASKQKAVQREKQTQAAAAERRSAELEKQVVDLSPEEQAYYRGLLKDIERGRPQHMPTRLSQFVRRNGGLDLAEVERFAGKGDFERLNILKGDGQTIDAMREMAEIAGWIDEGSTPDDFMQMLIDDVQGRPVYDPAQMDLVGNLEFIEDLVGQIEQNGADIKDVYDLASFMTGEQYRPASASTKGRLREAALREQYALKRLMGEDVKADDAMMAAHEARVYARTLRETAPEITERIDATKKILRDAIKEKKAIKKALARQELRAEASDDELFQNASQTVDRILSSPIGRLPYDNSLATSGLSKAGKKHSRGLSGRFHSRRLTIPDHEIEDFLEDDLGMLLRLTARSMVSDIELTRKFGSVDMERQLRAIEDDYAAMARDVDPKAKDAEKQIASLGKERDAVLRDVAAVRDRLRGTYGLPDDPDAIGFRTIQTIKALNHLRLMGGVSIASLPDAARVMFSHGLENFAPVAFNALTGNLKALKLSQAEARMAGTAFEMVNDTRTMALADLFDDYGRHSKAERTIAGMRNNFGVISLMAPWNHAMKSAANMTVQNRILAGARKLAEGKISKRDAEFMARLGISEDDARAIAAKFEEHGFDNNGLLSANTSAWGDQRLADTFHNALRAETDRMIVTPGQEKPLGSSTALGSFILQFQSYNFAATQRVAMAAAQGLPARDAHVAVTLIGQISLGMAVAALKMHQAGRGDELPEWNNRRWLAEGIDRSGVLGALTYVNLVAERTTAGRVGLSGLAGQGVLSRYHTRNVIGTFVGPGGGFVQDAFTVVNAPFQEGGLSDGDIAAGRRLLPYQNLFYINGVFNELERLLGSERFDDE